MKFVAKKSKTQDEVVTDQGLFWTINRSERRSWPEGDTGVLEPDDPIFDGLAPSWLEDEWFHISSTRGFMDPGVFDALREIYVFQRAYEDGRLEHYMGRGHLTRPRAEIFLRYAAICEAFAIEFDKRTIAIQKDELDGERLTTARREQLIQETDVARKRLRKSRRRHRELKRELGDRGW